MSKKMTFALAFCNRGFMPGELIYGARDDMVKAVTDAGYDYIMMDKELTRYGGIETRDEGLLYAKWLKQHEGQYDDKHFHLATKIRISEEKTKRKKQEKPSGYEIIFVSLHSTKQNEVNQTQHEKDISISMHGLGNGDGQCARQVVCRRISPRRRNPAGRSAEAGTRPEHSDAAAV